MLKVLAVAILSLMVPSMVHGQSTTPVQPAVTASGPSVTVSWDPPTLNEDGTPVSIVGYVIERKLSNSPNYLLFAVVGADKTTLTTATSKLAQCFRVRTIGAGWVLSEPSERACRAATP